MCPDHLFSSDSTTSCCFLGTTGLFLVATVANDFRIVIEPGLLTAKAPHRAEAEPDEEFNQDPTSVF
jgi:hypothetical protein